MFRNMRRFKQELSHEECVGILKEQPRGVLSLIGDDGYPYGVPIDYWYSEDDNKLYFHGAGEGHKMDAVKKCDKTSFCVYDGGYRKDGEWALNINSVISCSMYSLSSVNLRQMLVHISRILSLSSTTFILPNTISRSGSRVCCLELVVEHMTGKLVKES